MSVDEILAELPKLDPVELEQIFQRAFELHEKVLFTPSPELSKAIGEALAEPEEGDIPIEEAFRIVRLWSPN